MNYRDLESEPVGPCLALLSIAWGFPGCGSGKEPACQCKRREMRDRSWVGSIPWRRKWQSTSVFLPGDSYGRRSLEGCSLWGTKSWTWLSDLASSQIGASDYVTERPLYTSSSWLSSTNSAPSAQKSRNSSRSPRDDCFISLNCFHSLKWSLWWMGQIWVLLQPWGWLPLTT